MVSVLTPTYNRRAFIPQYLKYLRRQDYTGRVEVLIADDGEDSIEDLVKRDESIRYIRMPERRPIGYKRNLLAREARGDVLLHMDDDDYYPADRISHAVSRLLASERLIAGASMCYFYNAFRNELLVSGPFGPNHGLDATFAYRREYLEAHSFSDEAQTKTESAFTADFTVPMVQLDPRSTIVAIQHRFNTVDKATMISRPVALKLKEVIRDTSDRRFYRNLFKADAATRSALG